MFTQTINNVLDMDLFVGQSFSSPVPSRLSTLRINERSKIDFATLPTRGGRRSLYHQLVGVPEVGGCSFMGYVRPPLRKTLLAPTKNTDNPEVCVT
jgi:hypothetical protein